MKLPHCCSFNKSVYLTTLKCFIYQNASSLETGSSNEKETDFESKIETDRSKRFDYLLKQTEIFTHFMTNSSPKNTHKGKAGRPKKIKDTTASTEPTEPTDLAADIAE